MKNLHNTKQTKTKILSLTNLKIEYLLHYMHFFFIDNYTLDAKSHYLFLDFVRKMVKQTHICLHLRKILIRIL